MTQSTTQSLYSSIKVIAGPTASGKSAHALKLAQECNGVVINADSMQVYKDLPILTAQPSEEDLMDAPHRLYSVIDGAERYNAQRWVEMAKSEIDKCVENGKVPILCGGTGFYLKALMEGLSPIPDVPLEIRHFTENLQEMTGNPGFYELIKARDPEGAKNLDPYNTQRLIHAWEVLEHTGKPLSYWHSLPKKAPPVHWNFDLTVLMPDRQKLYANIGKRFDIMLKSDVMDEVVALYNRVKKGDVDEDATIIVAHGYRALRDYHLGKQSLETARELSLQDTRRYAKRQFTWFKNQIQQAGSIKNVTYLDI